MLRFLCTIAFCVALTQLLAWLGRERNKTDKIDDMTLHYIALTAIAIQFVAFTHASGLVFGNERTERYYDLTGALTYIVLTVISFLTSLPSLDSSSTAAMRLSHKHLLVNCCVLIWATRLGCFLFYRAHRNNGIDNRFSEFKKSLPRFAVLWAIQGVWVFVTSLPVFYLNASLSQSHTHSLLSLPPFQSAYSLPLTFYHGFQLLHFRPLSLIEGVGLILWVVGFLFESIADWQKFDWNQNEANKHRFIQTGLWNLSRHPNYFGEITLWCGIYIAASTDFSNIQVLAAMLSPIFVALLLINISGINILEKAADSKWGEDPEYKRYKKTVPVLIPFIGRAGDAAF
eukprot:gene37435-48966_t